MTFSDMNRILRELHTFETTFWPRYQALVAEHNGCLTKQIAYPVCLSAVRQLVEAELDRAAVEETPLRGIEHRQPHPRNLDSDPSVGERETPTLPTRTKTDPFKVALYHT